MKTRDNSSQLKFWRLPHLDNLELLHGSNITYDYPRHMHEEYSVALMLRGAEMHICRGASYDAFPGSLLLINADEPHSSRSVRTEYRVIKISPKTLSRISFELIGETPYFPDPVVKDPLTFRSLLNLHLKLEEKISPLEQESEFISAMGLLIKRQYKTPSTIYPHARERHYIKLVRDYLKSHYAENVSLSQLTSITNLSPFYLLRVFRDQVGFPPHEYQTQVRIAHARKLIRNGTAISQAALETGFFDQSHLSRNFKRILGMTPGQYLSQSKIVQDRAE